MSLKKIKAEMAYHEKNLVAIWELPPGIARAKAVFFWVFKVEGGYLMESACGLTATAASIQGLLNWFSQSRDSTRVSNGMEFEDLKQEEFLACLQGLNP